MNPQGIILDKNRLLHILQAAVTGVLTANQGTTMSSNQVLFSLPPALQARLAAIAGGYSPRCACGQAASYVGAAAAMEAKTNPGITHDRHHFCPVLNRYDDGFCI